MLLGAAARSYVLRGDPGTGVEERAPSAANGTITVVLPPHSASLVTVPGAARGAATRRGAGAGAP